MNKLSNLCVQEFIRLLSAQGVGVKGRHDRWGQMIAGGKCSASGPLGTFLGKVA